MNFLGFGFSGYRSIGEKPALIGPLKKINFIIGENNIGKSNITLFLKHHLQKELNLLGRNDQGSSLNKIDIHLDSRTPFHLALPVPNSADKISEYLSKIPDLTLPNRDTTAIANLLNHETFSPKSGISWLKFGEGNGRNTKLQHNINDIKIGINLGTWQSIWSKLTNRNGGDVDTWITDSLVVLAKLIAPLPKIELIPAIRKIGTPGTNDDDYSGEGIINRLAKLQNPNIDSQSDKIKFHNINKFLQTVLDNESATLEVPHDRDMILVHMDQRTLPLSSLGTGIHEVIILATAATVLDETLLCVEEPELHLHPLLQRKLINYLSKKTSNQYLFTTHSAHLLDTVGAEVFFVRKDEHCNTIVDAVTTTRERSNICHELGYKASDILQSNCIIWVEGPSDRIYLNFWIEKNSKQLIEGIHYSIMFYGGRLFSHLSGASDEHLEETTSEFIALRKLNRWSAIMFDSDKSSPRAKLSNTKERLKKEFDEGPGFAWVTRGREIENYIDPDIIEKCVKFVHPHATSLLGKDVWDNTLKFKQTGTKNPEATADKISIAKHYTTNYEADLSKLDLNQRINELLTFIHTANGFQSP
ncbi:conserved hypothetical protein [Pseudomonas sp. 8BK]|uniref:AAA family ATPase n=1 Tax=Pseudomonas sp. 8BK TaxID=2653164 RepID=UPI0012EF8BA4|nr:AAA family ATPase [Pseudomonas sp. 8BK]VXC03585.1 conserved hypothetical protein [Pseudomonas sp. 8BK]